MGIQVLGFSRTPAEFHQALGDSAFAKRFLDAGQTLQPAWANGAFIFVEGLVENDLIAAKLEFPLQPWHVVLKDGDEQQIFSILNSLKLKYQARPRIKQSQTQALTLRRAAADNDTTATSSQALSEHIMTEAAADTNLNDDDFAVEYDKTMVHIRLPKQITPRTSYTKSSTDKQEVENPGRSVNPRKWGKPPGKD